MSRQPLVVYGHHDTLLSMNSVHGKKHYKRKCAMVLYSQQN